MTNSTHKAVQAPQPALVWHGLSQAEVLKVVGEICDYGTGFVAPLISVVENIDKLLRERNATAPVPIPASEGGELPPLPVEFSRFKHEEGTPLYSADQMLAYARAALAAQPEDDAPYANAAFERGYQHGRQQERQLQEARQAQAPAEGDALPPLPKHLVAIDMGDDETFGALQDHAWNSDYAHELKLDAPLFAAGQMRDYARAALASKAQPKGAAPGVVEVTFDLDLGTPSVKVVQGEFERGRTYRLQGAQAPAPALEAPTGADTGDTNGRRDGLRPAVHGRMAVGGYTPGALADRLWASHDVMSLNAELGLSMDQLVQLAQAALTAAPPPADRLLKAAKGALEWIVMTRGAERAAEDLRQALIANRSEQAAQAPAVKDEVPRDVLQRCRDTAMTWTMKARVPECGEFGGIAQDLDALLGDAPAKAPVAAPKPSMTPGEARALIARCVICCEAHDREPCPRQAERQCPTCPHRIAASGSKPPVQHQGGGL